MSEDQELGSSEDWTYKRWYEDNKSEVSRRRREKYQSDEEYRKRVLARNKRYRNSVRMKEVVRKIVQEGKPQPPEEKSRKARKAKAVKRRRGPVQLNVRVGGAMVERDLMSIGKFAELIGRSVPCIYQWERRGILPRTPYELKGKVKSERLYLPEMAEVVLAVLESRGNHVSLSDETFHDDILDGWRKIGVEVEHEEG